MDMRRSINHSAYRKSVAKVKQSESEQRLFRVYVYAFKSDVINRVALYSNTHSAPGEDNIDERGRVARAEYKKNG